MMVLAPMRAQTIVAPEVGVKKAPTSFAVITDTETWNHCEQQLREYGRMLDEENLPTYIVYTEWKNPEQLRTLLKKMYNEKHLEGAVFVGNIPVPMIRKAQHLTSAFKMNENKYAWRDNSVPSDRYYDDFDLQFDFIRQDSVEKQFFYYDLGIYSPQYITCDIYTGRISPVASGKDYYRQINDYLKKVIKEHRSGNQLDQFVSYTGEGSFSNSLTAWTPEAFTIREQFPDVFDQNGRARFLRFNMFDYPKHTVLNTIKRNDLDLMIFHEHGTPDRQYLSGYPVTEDLNDHIAALKYNRRRYMSSRLNNQLQYHSYYVQQAEKYGIDSTWMKGFDSIEQLREDSLQDLKTGIVLSDVTEASPNVRMVIFDACYNGDFREKDYIAGRYIFSEGNTVVAYGNTVNVLQDKMANELLGMLGFGCRVGQWAQLTNILESHIIGDPTFKFRSNRYDGSREEERDLASVLSKLSCMTKKKQNSWALSRLKSEYADIQNISMHLLYKNRYRNLSVLLKKKYDESPFAMTRYTAFALLEKQNDAVYCELLKKSINDSYEFIRRASVHGMTKVGLDDYVPLLVKEYIDNRFSEREAFDIEMEIKVFGEKAINKALKDIVDSSYVIDKEKIRNKLLEQWFSQKESNSYIFGDKAKGGFRKLFIESLRNTNISASIDEYLKLVADEKEDEQIRIAMLDALAWFTESYRRQDIMDTCSHIMELKSSSEALRQQATRTYYRIKNACS